MKIHSTNFNIYSDKPKTGNIAFGHKSAYAYLKNIKGNSCACCGKEMILSKDISTIWGKITRPLATLMKEGRFNFAETAFPPIYKILADFANSYPNESLDSIVSDYNNHFLFLTSITDSFKYDADYNAASGQLKNKKIKSRTMDLLRISSAVMKNAFEVIQNLKPFERYLYGYRKDIFNELENLSVKYPDNKLHEIIRFPEVAETYIENTYNEAIEFAKIRDEHWNKANEIILKKAPEHWNKANEIILKKAPELKKPLSKLYTDICSIYRKDVMDPKRIAYEISEACRNFLDMYNLYEIKEDVLAEIAQMPVGLFSKNSFLSYARRYYNDGEIVNYVIKPFMESVEHVEAVSAGGTNNSSNIIILCRTCNNDRKAHPYREHLAIHPEMIVNAEKQIKFYSDKILSGELPEMLENYPIEIAKTLCRCSDGLMNYNVDYHAEALAKKHKGTNS